MNVICVTTLNHGGCFGMYKFIAIKEIYLCYVIVFRNQFDFPENLESKKMYISNRSGKGTAVRNISKIL